MTWVGESRYWHFSAIKLLPRRAGWIDELFEGDKPIGDPFAMEMKCGRLP